jgi:hypothetical protein
VSIDLITSELRSSVLKVTPELAARLLELNTHNRTPQERSIDAYTSMMLEGLWFDGVADVAISSDGVIVNGQHVLLAVVRSGVPVVVTVKTGLHPDSFSAYDGHSRRTAAQALQHAHDTKSAASAAAIIRRAAMVAKGSSAVQVPTPMLSAAYLANAEMWDTITTHADAVRRVGKRCGIALPPAAVGAFLWCTMQVDELDAGFAFAMAVADDAGHATGQPATTLRRWMGNFHRGGGSTLLVEHAAWVRAWNAHIEGRTLTKIHASFESLPAVASRPRLEVVA